MRIPIPKLKPQESYMVLLSMASLLGIASVTGGGVMPPLANPGTLTEPLTLAPRPLDKGDYRDQDVASLTLVAGQRDMLSTDDWKPVENQFTIGLEFDSYRPDDWVGIEAAFFYAKDESEGALGQNTEVSLGVRKTFTIGESGLHPYVGAGASYVWTTFGIDAPLLGGPAGFFVGDTDESLGFYAHGGLYYTIARFNVGVDIRTLMGTSVDLGGVSSDVDYLQYAATVGYGF